MRVHGAMASTFTLLLIGFIGLDLAHFGYPGLTKPTAVVLILCALNAWYMMAAAIYAQVFGSDSSRENHGSILARTGRQIGQRVRLDRFFPAIPPKPRGNPLPGSERNRLRTTNPFRIITNS
jgi:hypothetical protein